MLSLNSRIALLRFFENVNKSTLNIPLSTFCKYIYNVYVYTCIEFAMICQHSMPLGQFKKGLLLMEMCIKPNVKIKLFDPY